MRIIDSNVIFDIVTSDPVWFDWSAAQLDAAVLAGPLIVNSVVFAEVSVRYDTVEEVTELFTGMGLVMQDIPLGALFLAGQAFRRYRENGGIRTALLPDFMIGAHAAVRGMPLITRDKGAFRTYFPTLELITPTP